MNSAEILFLDWLGLMHHLDRSGIALSFQPVLKVLLASARSRNDLQRLHDEVLRGELRLNRQDYELVEAFWLKYFRDGETKRPGPLSPDLAYFLLNQAQDITSLTQYRRLQLEGAAGKIYHTLSEFVYNDEGWKNILSQPKRSGHGDSHYTGVLFGLNCLIGCWVRPDKVVRVSIQIWSQDLTEDLTHKIVSKLPKYDMACGLSSTDRGIQYGFVYDFAGTSLADKLHNGPNEGSQGPMMIGDASFADALFQHLRSVDIPITHMLIL